MTIYLSDDAIAYLMNQGKAEKRKDELRAEIKRILDAKGTEDDLTPVVKALVELVEREINERVCNQGERS